MSNIISKKVVCISDEMDDLTFGKVYEVVDGDKDFHYILNDGGVFYCYYMVDNFVTLKEYRRMKIEKINDKVR